METPIIGLDVFKWTTFNSNMTWQLCNIIITQLQFPVNQNKQILTNHNFIF